MAKTSHNGIVYLVGAGPGDPGLITVHGAQLLAECDAVVYDYLIPDELVVALPPEVERHYVGKRSGKHSQPQETINDLLVTLAKAGKRVVRLKGGDPFIFGRGGEEAAFLRDHDVPFEIVPGVTSGVAGPAYVGIPTTDRVHASFVMFLAGHKAADKEVSGVPWDWVARASGGTLVIYMGTRELPGIVEQLLAGGFPPDTPACTIERGTFPTQRMVSSTLGKLPSEVAAAGLEPPALTVIGRVVELSETLQWFERRPLFGLRVMVTRPADQAGWVYARLRDLGAEVLPCPTITTEKHNDEAAWRGVEALSVLQRWLVFTSENGVRYFMERWLQNHDVRTLAGFKVAAVGFGTARALQQYHLTPDFMPDKATTAELAFQMASQLDLRKAAVVRVRGNLGDDRVEKILQEAGASVIPLMVYRTFTPEWPPEMREKVLAYPPNVIMFTSGSTADGFVANLDEPTRRTLTEKAMIASIGPSTSEIIRSHGMTVGLEAKIHSIPTMIDDLVAWRQNR